jgi:hypothetical protein
MTSALALTLPWACGQRRRGPGIDGDDRRLPMDRHAGGPACLGQAQGVVERMQMAALGVVQAADIARRPDTRAHFGLVQQLRALVPQPVPFRLHRLQIVHVPRLEAGEQIALGQVAGDAMARDRIDQQALRLFGQVPQPARIIRPDPAGEGCDRRVVAGDDLAAVAPRRAPADPLSLQYRDLEPAERQMQRRRQAGIAGAEHGDIGPAVPAERRIVRDRIGRAQVPAVDMGGPVAQTRSPAMQQFRRVPGWRPTAIGA